MRDRIITSEASPTYTRGEAGPSSADQRERQQHSSRRAQTYAAAARAFAAAGCAQAAAAGRSHDSAAGTSQSRSRAEGLCAAGDSKTTGARCETGSSRSFTSLFFVGIDESFQNE